MRNKRYILIAVLSSIIFFFLFSIPSAMLSNPFFTRMTPRTVYEWFILIVTSILAGWYIGLYYYKKKQQSTKALCSATTGSFFGFLTYGCAFCNKLLLFLLGFSGITVYFLPLQPYLGIVSILLLSYGIWVLSNNRIHQPMVDSQVDERCVQKRAVDKGEKIWIGK